MLVAAEARRTKPVAPGGSLRPNHAFRRVERSPAQLHYRGCWGVAMAGSWSGWRRRCNGGRRKPRGTRGTLGKKTVRGQCRAAAAAASSPSAGAARFRAAGHAADSQGGTCTTCLAAARTCRQRIVSIHIIAMIMSRRLLTRGAGRRGTGSSAVAKRSAGTLLGIRLDRNRKI